MNVQQRGGRPLPVNLIRGLNDKLYDKRKAAALEIQKMAKNYLRQNEHDKIQELISVLQTDFCSSTNGNARKGGLIGLAGMAIALEQESQPHLRDLFPPVLGCFEDPDSRVRYYACEALYNIAKVGRGRVLPYFNEIFDKLCRLAADSDPNVRNGAELLDRLVKDIVTESTNFAIDNFIPLLRDRIYNENPYVRRFLVSWISVLDSVPDIELLDYLHEFLDGLFRILSDESNDIRRAAETQLTEFLREIKATGVNYSSVVHVLVKYCDDPDELTQFTALFWLKEFIILAGDELSPFQSHLLSAILPAISHNVQNIRENAIEANQSLTHLVESRSESHLGKDSVPDPGFIQTMEILKMNFHENRHLATRLASLRWVLILHLKQPQKVFSLVNSDKSLLASLLKCLSDEHDKVVLLDIEVLAELVSYAGCIIHPDFTSNDLSSYLNKEISSDDIAIPEGKKDTGDITKNNIKDDDEETRKYFMKFIVSLLGIFNSNRELLKQKGSLIICQLCILLDPEKVFRAFSEILYQEEDLEFAQHMVQHLNSILLTASELRILRDRLKKVEESEENLTFYVCLYRSWSHNSVATFSLCLLAQTYKHASLLLRIFGEMEATVNFLLELDRLVQLLESPIFTYLRLQLLEVEEHPYLIKCLYGILMLLPQSKAYNTLRNRLQACPILSLPNETNTKSKDSLPSKINFDALLKRFTDMQIKHVEVREDVRRRGRQ